MEKEHMLQTQAKLPPREKWQQQKKNKTGRTVVELSRERPAKLTNLHLEDILLAHPGRMELEQQHQALLAEC
jgi:hypothetical protein